MRPPSSSEREHLGQMLDAFESEFNPYAAPEAGLEPEPSEPIGVATPEDEAIRRRHMNRERSIRALGLLFYLFALPFLIGSVGLGLLLVVGPFLPGRAGMPPQIMGLILGGGAFYALMAAIFWGLGRGLRRLRPWARWTCAALTSLLFLIGLIGTPVALYTKEYGAAVAIFVVYGVIPGVVLLALLTAKGTMVFSREYAAILARTPHLRPRTSPRTWLIAAVLIALIVVAVVLAAVLMK